MTYTQSQWVLVFFLYSFLGWLWESLYVGVQQKAWVNRGFLHGPILPIYGFGAIVILLVPFQDNIALTWLFGMLSATALEYLTGVVMERLFHIRYWDYSNTRFNLHGYICLFSSLGWGFFSLILVYLIHPPIDKILLRIPLPVADFASFVLMAGTMIDTTKSVQSALDMKELLTQLSEHNRLLAFAEQELSQAFARIPHRPEKPQRLAEGCDQPNPETRRIRLSERMDQLRNRKAEALQNLSNEAERLMEELNARIKTAPRQEKTQLSGVADNIRVLQEKIRKAKKEAAAHRSQEFERVANIIKRNSNVTSAKFRESLEELKDILSSRKSR